MSTSPFADLVTATLRSKPCADIAFEVAGTNIRGYHYGYAADLVDKGAIKIGPPSTNPGFAGEYGVQSQTVFLKGGKTLGFFASADGKETIVHECTHAIVHLLKAGKTVRHIDEEFTAWLASTIYRLNAGFAVIGSQSNAPTFRKNLLFVAQKCIKETGFKVDPLAIDSVGKELIAAEKAAGKHVPDSFVMPPFNQAAKANLPPMVPDP